MATSKLKSKKTPLNTSIRSYIISELIKPQDALVNAKKAEIIGILQTIYMPAVPRILIEAMEAVKDTAFKLRTLQVTVDAYTFIITGVPSMNEYAYTSNAKEYSEIINLWRENPQAANLLSLTEELRVLYAERNSLANQMSCVLSNIKTEEGLASEFPEAYTAYIELKKKNNLNKPPIGCDNVEKLRATLSKVRSTASKIEAVSKEIETKVKSRNKK